MTVELRHLRYFVAVAEEASFTAAARRVHVSQQVLSAQVRQLEGTLGVTLMTRDSRGVQLTAAGRTFLDGAHDTLRALERATAGARMRPGRLTVGLNAAAGGDLPTSTMTEFEADNPGVQVTLRTFDLTQPAAGLLDGSTDVAFVRPPIDAPGLDLRVLTSEARVFVLPSGNPLAARDDLSPDDVAGLPWVAAAPATDGCAPNSWRDDWLLDSYGPGRATVIGAVARTVDEWREHVAAGRGISLCPASAETHYARPGLAFVPSRDTRPARLCVAARRGETNSAVVRFLQFATSRIPAGSAAAL